MSDTVMVALIGFLGTAVGSGLGAMTSLKLISYRLEQLEKKVEKHNNLVERTYKLEKQESLIEEKMDVLHESIEELKEFHK